MKNRRFMLKKLMALTLATGMCISMAACGSGSSTESSSKRDSGRTSGSESSSEESSSSKTSNGVDQDVVDEYVLSYHNGYYHMLVPDSGVMWGDSSSLTYLELYETETEDNPWSDMILFSQGDYFEEEQGVDVVRTMLANGNILESMLVPTDRCYKVKAVDTVTYTADSTSEYTNENGYDYILESGTVTLTYDTSDSDWDYHERHESDATSMDLNYVMYIIKDGMDFDGNAGFVIMDISDEQDQLSDIITVASTMAESYGTEE